MSNSAQLIKPAKGTNIGVLKTDAGTGTASRCFILISARFTAQNSISNKYDVILAKVSIGNHSAATIIKPAIMQVAMIGVCVRGCSLENILESKPCFAKP